VLKDGEWLVVDVGYGINMAQRDYVRMGVWGKNLSFAYAEYQNGSKEDVTKFYTNTSLVIFNVVDANNLPVGGMEVLLKSNFLREWLPDNPQYTDSIDTQNYCITNSFGTCMLTVGGNNYTIEVRPQIIGLVYTTDRKIVIIAGENERDPYIITLRSNNFELTFIGKIFALFVVAVVVIVTVLLGLIYYARHRKPKKWSYRFKN
jgi:hypothetical protein